MKRRNPNQWAKERAKDEYVIKANKDGYRARSAYKLLEINKKTNLIRKNSSVLDLGAAPGSWLQVTKKLTQGKIIGIDLLEIKPIKGVEFFKGDIASQECEEFLDWQIQKIDVILSDMAPNTSGNKSIDHLQIMNLAEIALEIAEKKLAKGGNLCIKIFEGKDLNDFVLALRKRFEKVLRIKPNASRPESPELYLISLGFQRDLTIETSL